MLTKDDRGITLVALIITIIVLVILAAVTIKSVVKNGMVDKAVLGVENYADDQYKEVNSFEEVSQKIDNTVDNIISQQPASGDKEETETEVVKEKSYVGYYADTNADGVVDGVIYADLIAGTTKSREWFKFDAHYDIQPNKETKKYYVSQKDYEGAFGKKDVLASMGDGEDRFYVMALEDIKVGNISYFYWYYNAFKKYDTTSNTSVNFNTGKENTKKVLDIWKDGTIYGEGITVENKGDMLNIDMWGSIENKVKNEGWFAPSYKEWLAFAAEFEINRNNYMNFNLNREYWSSSGQSSYSARVVEFNYDRMNVRYMSGCACVRLSKTF